MAIAVATAGSLSYPGALWTNTSTPFSPSRTAAPLNCLPCSYLQIEPGYATWTPNLSIKPLATTQVIVDPNNNTTFTSIRCDTEVLSSYSSRLDLSYTVDGSCNLVAKYVGVYGGSGNTADFQWATVTLTEPTGIHVQMGGNFAAHGEISTTDTNGQPTCLSDWGTYYSSPVGVYTDSLATDVTASWTVPITSTATVDGSAVVTTAASYTTAYGEFWLMPELRKYLPGLAAASQCLYVIPGGSPMALQPANSVRLPTSTLPRANPGTTTTAASQDESSTSEVTPRSIATRVGAALPAITSGQSNPPTESSHASAAKGPLSYGPSARPPSKYSAGPATSTNLATAAADLLPDPIESTTELNALSILVAAMATPSAKATHVKASSAAIVVVAGLAEGYVVGQNTISAGGPALTTSGTVFSALPFGSGILLEANGRYTTVPASALPTPDAARIEAYLIGSETAFVGGPEITSSGTIYSALPSGIGVIAVAGDHTTTLNGPEVMSFPGIGLVSAVSDEYVLGGSATISVGGSALSASGIEYSALPFGEGAVVVVVAAGYTTTIVVPGPTAGAAFSTTTVLVEGSASAVYVTQTRRPPSLVSAGLHSSYFSGRTCRIVTLAVLAILTSS